MRILVINCGSSSIKYQLFDTEKEEVIFSGEVEKIGEEKSILVHYEKGKKIKKEGKIRNHEEAFKHIEGFIKGKRIDAVGHRVVHGGEAFKDAVLVDEAVEAEIERNIHLAPLHNPHNLEGIRIAKRLFPSVPHVAVFDTAFFHNMPEEAFLYAIPYCFYEKYRIRKYGFHGTSHMYVAKKTASYMKRPLEELNLITVHLGNGASMAAIEKGRAVDTSMGMTPLEGLIMGTRSGDIDPGVLFFLIEKGLKPEELYRILNRESGLKGICGMNDMRKILEKREENSLCDLAIRMYARRIKKYLGAYMALLGDVDAISFTAGIGENSSEIRWLCCKGLESLGIKLDPEKNRLNKTEISKDDSKIKVFVIKTDEQLVIAKQTEELIQKEAL